ncbi:TPA: hypothetical protein PC521_003540 [Klebsiella michiganensis]|nr:hypothetical protein [Klebsiella michiganensis]
MPFYLTGNPVPSASVLDIRDNSQNLDLALNDITSSFWSDRLGRSRMSWFGLESAFTVKLSDFESRFSTQIVEQETTFDASQADKENRFQAFLDSSGYVFLGDYEDGPFQFSARNQYIRYNNQYYRLNAATDVGFITTGTDATSFANDVTHFVLMDGDTIRQDLGSGEGFKWVGQVRSASALSALPGSDGDRVLLLGYREGWAATNSELSGGGEFIYVSELAGENNGITVFNGWVRKFTRSVITTFDAGLLPGKSEDHFAQMQKILDVIPDGFTFEIHGEHRLSSQLIMEVKRNITIVGAAAKLTTKPYKSTIKVVRLASDGITYMGGILSAINCPGLRLDGDLEIEGTRMYPNVLRSDQTAAGEEHGLHFRYCDDLYIGKDIYVHDVFGYGAVGVYCNRSFADRSLFTDTVRESGLNLFGGSVGGRAFGVRTRRTALYGIEIEDTWYGGARDIKVIGCDVADAYWGIPTVNNCSDVEVSRCSIRRARFGAQALQSSAGAYDTRNIRYHGNTYTGCPVGFRTAHPRNVRITRESIDQSDVMPYGYTFPFNNLLFVDDTDRRIFWGPTTSLFLKMVGQTIYIDDVAYTITAAATDATKTGYWKDFATDPDSLVKVTLDKALPKNTDTQTVKSKDWGTAVRGILTEGRSVNLTIWNNDLTGDSLDSIGIYHNSYNMDGVNTVNEYIRGNTFRAHGIWLRMNDAVNTRDVSDNKYADGSQIGISAANLTAAVLSQIKMGNNIRVALPARTSVSAGAVTKYFNANQRYWAIGLRISFTGLSGTGEMRVAIDGTQTHSTTSYSTGTAVVEIYGVATFTKGNHQIAINTANSDIVFTSCDIELLIP